MSDYIRKQDAVDMCGGYGCLANLMRTIKPADVVQVVHGKWLNAIFDSKHYRCSICNYHISNLVRENYCPNCGAKMDGEE